MLIFCLSYFITTLNQQPSWPFKRVAEIAGDIGIFESSKEILVFYKKRSFGNAMLKEFTMFLFPGKIMPGSENLFL